MITVSASGPTEIKAGQSFSEQPDGSNCIWISVQEPVSIYAKVSVSGVDFLPHADDARTLLTVALPPAATHIPGELRLQVKDGIRASAIWTIPIQPDQARPAALLEDVRAAVLKEAAFRRDYPWTFLGWSMGTCHSLPWDEDPEFAEVLRDINRQHAERFESSFDDMTAEHVAKLRWRHAVFYYAVTLALRQTKLARPVFVECGVGDGLTAHVGLTAMEKYGAPWRAMLFDLWGALPDATLSAGETAMRGRYAELQQQRTKRNLAGFESVELVAGELPGTLARLSFAEGEGLAFVHIDLNVAKPTLDCVHALFPMLTRGGVMLFDDFGWSPHADTRTILKDVLPGLGMFLMMPTGQGMLIKT